MTRGRHADAPRTPSDMASAASTHECAGARRAAAYAMDVRDYRATFDWRIVALIIAQGVTIGPIGVRIPFPVEEITLARRMITEKSQQASAVRRNSNCRARSSLYTFLSEHDPLGRSELPPFILQSQS